MRLLAIADSAHVPASGSVAGPLMSLPSSGSRIAVCLRTFYLNIQMNISTSGFSADSMYMRTSAA